MPIYGPPAPDKYTIDKSSEGRTRKYISKVIVHCSDSEWGNFKHIDSWHKERWSGIKHYGKRIYCGYHYIIKNGKENSDSTHNKETDGKVEKGRPNIYVGAHCKGQNLHSIGICLIGVHDFTIPQLKSLARLIDNLANKYDSVEGIYPHNAFSTKTCPNFDVKDFLTKWIAGFYDG